MLEIDGSQKSGSGTILRLSVALSAILSEPLHIYNIRQKREQPGLRPQHLEAVLTAAKLCDAEIKGASLNSRELWFTPKQIYGGEVKAEIGTAGSIPMLLLTVLPICAFAKNTVHLRIVKGGTDVRNAPTINYIKHVLLQMLNRMNLKASLIVHRYGYYPKGMGEVSIEAQPNPKLNPILLEEFGRIIEIHGVSVCTFLEDRKVAERQAKAANNHLKTHGLEAKIEIINDKSNPLQKGSSMVMWAKTSTGAFIGGDAIGELGKPSETVGKEAAENLFREIEARATVDIHLADILVPYVALTDASSIYLTRDVTDHLETNIWLTEKILDAKLHVTKVGELYQIEKKGS